MKKVQLTLAIAILTIIGLSSCGEVCVRCENGISGETETKCFTDDDERDEYVNSRELAGFDCNDE